MKSLPNLLTSMRLVMALFMFVGATRGWFREFFTSCALVVLTAILLQPALAAPIIDYIARLVRLVVAFIAGRGSVDPTRLLERYRTIQLPFDGKNPYLFLVVVLVAFVFLSYSTRSNEKSMSALNRILGGLLGLCNGYLSVWLVTQYVLKYFSIRAPQLSAAARPSQVSVAVLGLPTTSLLPGEGGQSILLLFFLMTVFVLLGRLTTRSVTKK
jgi:hypothetical protein